MCLGYKLELVCGGLMVTPTKMYTHMCAHISPLNERKTWSWIKKKNILLAAEKVDPLTTDGAKIQSEEMIRELYFSVPLVIQKSETSTCV